MRPGRGGVFWPGSHRSRAGCGGVYGVMRAWLLAVPACVIMLAGCGGVVPPSAGRTAAGARPPARFGSVGVVEPSRSLAAPVWGWRASAGVPGFTAGFLAGVRFVSAAEGWVVGQGKILATTGGGRYWAVQDRGGLDLTSVDFVCGEVGWAVGTHLVLAASDGRGALGAAG